MVNWGLLPKFPRVPLSSYEFLSPHKHLQHQRLTLCWREAAKSSVSDVEQGRVIGLEEERFGEEGEEIGMGRGRGFQR